MKSKHWLAIGIIVGFAAFLLVTEVFGPTLRVLAARVLESQSGGTVSASTRDVFERGYAELAALAGIVAGGAIFGLFVWIATRTHPWDRVPGLALALRLGMAGCVVGLVIAILTRPSAPLVGQLPLGIVLTRGATLTGLDLLLRTTAESSFNQIAVVCIVGTLMGAAFGWFVGQRKAADLRAPHEAGVSLVGGPNSTLRPDSFTDVAEGAGFCVRCGAKLPSGAAYCGACGTKRADVG